MESRLLCLSLALATLLGALVGCSRGTPLPLEPSSEPSPFQSALASPAFQSPIPMPTMTSGPLLARNPTPEPGSGTVQGVLTMHAKPAAGRILYLAAVIQTAGEGIGGVAALDPVNDPRAESDASGYFVFLNVPPGRYALGINSPVGPVLINQKGREIMTEVQADQIADLETVQIVPFAQ